MADKSDILDKISTLKVSYELEKQGLNKRIDLLNNIESAKRKNKQDSFSFMTDILMILVGQSVINNVIAKVTGGIDTVQDQFKDTLRHDLLSDYNNVNAEMTPAMLDGFDIHITSVDPFSNLRLDINSPDAKALFGKEGTPFYNLYNAVKISPGTSVDLNNFVTTNYNSTTGLLHVTPKSGFNFNEFVNGYIDSLTLIDSKTLLSEAMYLLFNLGNQPDVTSTEDIEIYEQTFQVLDSISKNQIKDDYFLFDTDTKLDIQNRLIQQGSINTAIGCGINTATITAEDVMDIMDSFDSSFNELTISEAINSLGNSIVDKSSASSSSVNDQESIKNNFFTKLINYIKMTFLKRLIFSPEVQILFGFLEFVNDKGSTNINKTNSLELIGKRLKITKCITNGITSAIISIMFSLLTAEVAKLMASIISIYAKEALDKYQKIIKSIF